MKNVIGGYISSAGDGGCIANGETCSQDPRTPSCCSGYSHCWSGCGSGMICHTYAG